MLQSLSRALFLKLNLSLRPLSGTNPVLLRRTASARNHFTLFINLLAVTMKLVPYLVAIFGLTASSLAFANYTISANSTIEKTFAAIGEEGLSRLHKVTYECQR
jgi:hypothetical protein